MTKQHDVGYYDDNHVPVAYCKRCSAEGEKLLEDCHGEVNVPYTIDELVKKYEDDIENPLDKKKPTAK